MQAKLAEDAESGPEIDPVRTIAVARNRKRRRLPASPTENKARLMVFTLGVLAAAFLIWLYNVTSAAAR